MESYDILKNVFAHTLQVNGAQTNTGKKLIYTALTKQANNTFSKNTTKNTYGFGMTWG